MNWQERAEKAEAELERLREQEPVAWMLECQQWTGDTAWILSWSKSGAGQCNRLDGESHQRALYERPIPRERSDSIPAPATAVPAVPDIHGIVLQLTLAETEMFNAKAWSPGSQAKRHIDFAVTAIGCARALLQSAPTGEPK